MVNQKIENIDLIDAQTQVWSHLCLINNSKKIGSAYLFSGPAGSGKEYIAIKFGQLINCEKTERFPCESCPSCQRFKQLQHEKLSLIFPLPNPNKSRNDDHSVALDKQNLGIVTESIAQKAKTPFFKIQIPKAKRILIQSVKGLRKSLYLKTDDYGRKIVLVFDAHLLSVGQGEAANALLKILEEPPENTTLILVTDHVELLLPTILSRCQRIGFPPFENEFVYKWLTGKITKDKDLQLLSGLSQGNIHQAQYLISQPIDQLMKLINGLIKTIINENPDHWRKFTQTYSRLSSQDFAVFSFHFMLLKIWFRSVNRLNKNIHDLLHETPLRLGMDQMVQSHPNANFSAIAFQLEETILSVQQNLYMPLILTNLLLRIQKYLGP